MAFLSVWSNLVLLLLPVILLSHEADAVSKGTVRFVRHDVPTTTQEWSSGIVQIYYSGRWGNICEGDDFGYDEADVLCHQFGYTGSSSYTNTQNSFSYGQDSTETVLTDVSCSSSSYLTISQCELYTGSSCYTEDVIVSCYSTRIWYSPTSGDIRLTGGMYSNQGLLEVYCNGDWGTVCDDNFYSTQATVACKQLGYNDYYDYDHLSIEGTYSQSIWLQDLGGCFSSQTCLTQCGGCPSVGVSICDHYEDITLECEYSYYSAVSSDVYSTCDYVVPDDTGVISFNSSISFDDGDYNTILIGVVVASIIGFILCVLLITVPICVVVCIVVGTRSTSVNRPPRQTNVAYSQLNNGPPESTTDPVQVYPPNSSQAPPLQMYQRPATGPQAPPPPVYPTTGSQAPPVYPITGSQAPPPPVYSITGSQAPPPPVYPTTGLQAPPPPVYPTIGSQAPPPPAYPIGQKTPTV